MNPIQITSKPEQFPIMSTDKFNNQGMTSEPHRSQPFPKVDIENISIIELENERFKWSQKAFPNASVSGSLFHLKKEILEIEDSIENGSPDPVEFADAQMMLWDTMQRCGVTLNDMFEAFNAKFHKNKMRKWNQQPEGHYQHEKGYLD